MTLARLNERISIPQKEYWTEVKKTILKLNMLLITTSFILHVSHCLWSGLSKVIQHLWNKQIWVYAAGFFFAVMGFFSVGFSAAGIFLAAAFFLTRGFFWFLRPTAFFLPCHRNYYFLYELANHLTLGDFDFHWGWIVKGILWILSVLLV